MLGAPIGSRCSPLPPVIKPPPCDTGEGDREAVVGALAVDRYSSTRAMIFSSFPSKKEGIFFAVCAMIKG